MPGTFCSSLPFLYQEYSAGGLATDLHLQTTDVSGSTNMFLIGWGKYGFAER